MTSKQSQQKKRQVHVELGGQFIDLRDFRLGHAASLITPEPWDQQNEYWKNLQSAQHHQENKQQFAGHTEMPVILCWTDGAQSRPNVIEGCRNCTGRIDQFIIRLSSPGSVGFQG